MRHLKDLFTVPKGEKVTETHLRRVLIASVCSILLCMTCLVSTTWAWFSVTVTSENNVIHMGNFDPVVTVTGPQEQTVTPDASGTYHLSSGTYKVEIANKGNVKGFCKLYIGTGEYHVTLGVESDFSFKVTVSDGSNEAVSMYISGCWGTPAQSDNETLSLNGLSVEPVNTLSGDDETASTEPTQESTAETEASEEPTQPVTQEAVPTTQAAQPTEDTQATATEPEVSQPSETTETTAATE